MAQLNTCLVFMNYLLLTNKYFNYEQKYALLSYARMWAGVVKETALDGGGCVHTQGTGFRKTWVQFPAHTSGSSHHL